MRAKIDWKGEARFEGKTGSGHVVTMDGPPEQGGANSGARPMELMLLGLGGCTAFDVMMILRKARAEVSDCQVTLEATRADEVPSVFTQIHIQFVVTGQNLQDSLVARAVKLSAEKYCSASIMLERAGVKIDHSYKIVSEA